MSNITLRSIAISTVASVIATGISVFALNNFIPVDLAILGVLFFMVAMATALVIANNKTETT